GLAREFELRLVEEIRASEWYEFVDSERTRKLLFQYGYTLDDLKIAANRARIAQDLRIDAIIVGDATYYFGDVYLGPVGCAACQSPLQRSWFVEQFTTVAVHVTARMINLHTGQEVHFLRAVGEEWSTLRIPISWEGDANNPPPPAFIPNPNRQQIPQTRSAAIESAVKAFARDILPTQEWTLARSWAGGVRKKLRNKRSEAGINFVTSKASVPTCSNPGNFGNWVGSATAHR